VITRCQIIQHILFMKTLDETYARWALKSYNEMLPDWQLNDGVREAMKATK